MDQEQNDSGFRGIHAYSVIVTFFMLLLGVGVWSLQDEVDHLNDIVIQQDFELAYGHGWTYDTYTYYNDAERQTVYDEVAQTYADPTIPVYTACDSLNEQLTYLYSMNIPQGLVVVGGDCSTVDMTGGAWPTWGYPGSPEDVWEYQVPDDAVYDVFGNSDNPLSTDEVPNSQHPFYPEALSIQDMVPNTLVCMMTGDVAQGSFVVTGIGVYLSKGYMMYGVETPPYLYWTDGNGQPIDLTLNGVIPSEDGNWSTSWLKAGTCDF